MKNHSHHSGNTNFGQNGYKKPTSVSQNDEVAVEGVRVVEGLGSAVVKKCAPGCARAAVDSHGDVPTLLGRPIRGSR